MVPPDNTIMEICFWQDFRSFKALSKFLDQVQHEPRPPTHLEHLATCDAWASLSDKVAPTAPLFKLEIATVI